MKREDRNKTYLLGIDVGTSGLKACILDENARQAALTRAAYRSFALQKGWEEIDAGSLWQAVLQAVGDLKDEGIDLSRVAGIGLSVLCPALVCMDERGGVLAGPILYSDRRSTAEAEEILQKVGAQKLFAVTANGSMAGGLSGSSLLWVRKHRPQAYERSRWFGLLNSWLCLKMTGQTAIDPTNASYTNLFDTAAGDRWSQELCGILDVDMAKLPRVLQPCEAAGVLTSEDLISLGLPAGIPVAAGAGDTSCAALACGVLQAGSVFESVGTSNVLTVCTDRPRFDRRLINRAHLVPHTWTYHGSMSFTGAANEWFCREFENAGKKPDGSAFERSNEEAAKAPAGCGGVVFLPYMQGERSPVWDPYARGVFFGMSLSSSRADLNRAVLESCGYGMRHFLELSEQLSGKRIERFLSIGGGAKSPVWAQIKADITGRTIDVLQESDMAASGAALLGGICAGVWPDLQTAADALERPVWRTFEPNHENDAVYARNYALYQRLYPSLRDMFAAANK